MGKNKKTSLPVESLHNVGGLMPKSGECEVLRPDLPTPVADKIVCKRLQLSPDFRWHFQMFQTIYKPCHLKSDVNWLE